MHNARSQPSDHSLQQQLIDLNRAVAEQKSPTKDQVIRFCAIVAMLGIRADKTDVDEALVAELPALTHKIWKGVGFSAATRAVCRANPERWLTAVQVRDLLVAAGFNLRKYSFPMAQVHNTLKRFYQHGLLERKRDKFEGSLYRWWIPADVPRLPWNPK